MKCTNCGQQVDPAVDNFCGYCQTRVAPPGDDRGVILERSQPEAMPQADLEPIEAFQQVAPPPAARSPQAWRFRLAKDEIVLKTYRTVQLHTGPFKRKRGEGALFVTSARAVFYASVEPRGAQRASALMQQTKLEDISGLSVQMARRISPGLLMFTIFFGLAAFGTLLTVVLIPLTILFAILTGICVLLLVRDAKNRGSISISIHSRENGHSPINFGHGGRVGSVGALGRVFLWPILFFFPSYSAIDVTFGDPAEDAERLVEELGALIIDLQTRGTTAYPDWGISAKPERAHSAGVS